MVKFAQGYFWMEKKAPQNGLLSFIEIVF